jgi:UDP-N-acetylmuramate dehydrogenase
MHDISTELRTIFGDQFKENEPMSRHTNFRIGGPARFFVEVRSIEEIEQVVRIAEGRYVILGGGSNMLVSDKGFDGLVIKMAMREIQLNKNRVQADAGVLMTMLSRKVADASLSGLEWAITLPGTVGGAVRGNAGCFGGETRDHLVEALVLSEGKVVTRSNEELAFGYRESSIKSGGVGSGFVGHSSDIVLSATFDLSRGESTKIKQTMESNLAKRKTTQPLDAGSAGCMFKNYEIVDETDLKNIQLHIELPEAMVTARQISAGWIIDRLDLKGFQLGGAKVSEKHGNFLLNTGNATADEVVQLIALIKTRARNAFGIQLQEEVQYVGM